VRNWKNNGRITVCRWVIFFQKKGSNFGQNLQAIFPRANVPLKINKEIKYKDENGQKQALHVKLKILTEI